MDEFILEGAKETLRHRVVITVPFPTHTRRHPQHRELLLIRGAAVLCPLIRVMD